jgi:hypothetical protein
MHGRLRSRRLRAGVLASVALGLLPAREGRAWVYPEHRDITVQALVGLDPQRRATIDGLWTEARAGHEARLCQQVVEAAQGEEPSCFDWAAWPAVAGDHSCSAAEMVHTILESGWILEVAAIGERLKRRLAGASSHANQINDLLRSDVKLERADDQYATRASSNNVHFLLARPNVDITRADYFRLSLAEGAEPSAIGAYAWYHLAALVKASRLPRAAPGTAERAALARAVLADEAFALHFLEDAFSAGHVAGTWGKAAVRKGTHDYYNEHGLDARTWDNVEQVLEGDAHMRPEDARRAGDSARSSIAQIADAASGRLAVPSGAAAVTASPEELDVCKLTAMPALAADPAAEALGADIAGGLPVPALTEGPGAVPRFRSELGPFIGLSAAAGASYITGGFEVAESQGGAIAGLEMGVRFGFGLEGVMDESGDGLVFLDVGLRQDASSTQSFSREQGVGQGGAITAALPARSAFTISVRAPFWVVPGDLLLAALFVAPFSRRTFEEMASQAANGGLLPWQAGLATPIGRFQFVVGREVGISFYGYNGKDRMIMSPVDPDAPVRVIALRSISFEFPLVEYRPFRAFSLDQASVLRFQVVGGFQTANHVTLIAPEGAPLPDMHIIYSVGLRLAFDWRHY